jgi:signal transduction histidine kinase
VITHAQASHVEVRLVRDAGHVDLAVTDDGKGFDVAEARRQSDGLGLVSMGERARLVGGTMSLFTQVNKGTRLRVLVPANEKALESQPA